MSEILKLNYVSFIEESIISIIKNKELYFESIKNTINQIEKDIIDNIASYIKQYTFEYTECLNEMNTIKNSVSEIQNKFEKYKNKYFDACKHTFDLERGIMKLAEDNKSIINIENDNTETSKNNNEKTNCKDAILTNSNNTSITNNITNLSNQNIISIIPRYKKEKKIQNEINNSIELLTKCRLTAENNFDLYKQELDKNIDLYSNYEIQYSKLKNKLSELQESKAILYKTSISYYSKSINTIAKITLETYSEIEKKALSLDTSLCLKEFEKLNKKFYIKTKVKDIDLKLLFNKNMSNLSSQYYLKLINETSYNNNNCSTKQLDNISFNDSNSYIEYLRSLCYINRNKSIYLRFFIDNIYSYEVLKRNYNFIRLFLNKSFEYHYKLNQNFIHANTFFGSCNISNSIIDNYDSSSNNNLKENTYNKIKEVEDLIVSKTCLDNEKLNSLFDKLELDSKEKKSTEKRFSDDIINTLLNLNSFKVENYDNFQQLSSLVAYVLSYETSSIRILKVFNIICSFYYQSLIKLDKNNSNQHIDDYESEIEREYLTHFIKLRQYTDEDECITLINDIISKRINNKLITYLGNSINYVTLKESFNYINTNNIFKNTNKENKSMEECIKFCKLVEDIKEETTLNSLLDFCENMYALNLSRHNSIAIIKYFSNVHIINKPNSDYLKTYLLCNFYSIKTNFSNARNIRNINETICNINSSSNSNKKRLTSTMSIPYLKISKNKVNVFNSTDNIKNNSYNLNYSINHIFKYLDSKSIRNLIVINKEISKSIIILLNSKQLNSLTNINNIKSNYRIIEKRIKIWKTIMINKLDENFLSLVKRYNNLVINNTSNIFTNNSTEKEDNLSVLDNNKIINKNLHDSDIFVINNLKEEEYALLIKNIQTIASLKSVYNEICLDTVRTFYNASNSDELRNKLTNILKAIAYTTSISYCQGMNYVGCFLLYLTNQNEKEAFELFYLLVQSTEYKQLFSDNQLYNLKKMFYIFERSIALLLPEIKNAFNKANILPSLFSSSWFITLFTGNICSDKLIENSSKINYEIIINVWDNFIKHGWYSFMKFCIGMLKINQNKIINCSYEGMLQFLLNDIFTEKNLLLIDENIAKNINYINNLEYDISLFESLEDEYYLKKKTLI